MARYTVTGNTGRVYKCRGTAECLRYTDRVCGDNAEAGHGFGWVRITHENGAWQTVTGFNLLPKLRAHNVRLALARFEKVTP
jgi:hypothetical protein